MFGRFFFGVLALATALEFTQARAVDNSSWPINIKRLGVLEEAGVMVGRKVKDRNNKVVGKVEDILVDLPSGRALAALVAAKANGPLTPLPAFVFTNALKDRIDLVIDKKLFEGAPRLPRTNSANTLETGGLSESFRYFGRAMPEGPAIDGRLCSGASLVGMALLSQANEPLGQVKALMVDLPEGRAVYLVIEPATGPGTHYYVVPSLSVQPDTASRALRLKADQAHFMAGPRFQKEFWTDMAFPDFATAIIKYYNLQPPVVVQAAFPTEVSAVTPPKTLAGGN
jgi:sporulation protein YlmC with PRC-barrel domain